MNYILDTNICIHIIQRKSPNLLKKISQLRNSEFYISTITEAELWYGVMNSQRRNQNEEALRSFLPYFNKLPFDSYEAIKFAEAKYEQKKIGKLIGPYDLLIAAQTLEMGATLVTANEKEFKQIKGLKTENWLRATA